MKMTNVQTYNRDEDGTLTPVTAVYMTAEELKEWTKLKEAPKALPEYKEVTSFMEEVEEQVKFIENYGVTND